MKKKVGGPRGSSGRATALKGGGSTPAQDKAPAPLRVRQEPPGGSQRLPGSAEERSQDGGPAGRRDVGKETLLTEERRQRIVAMLHEQRRVIVADLSRSFGVSEITIRKDLEVLQNRGLLKRSRGGALLPASNALHDPSIREKQKQHTKEKERIAAAAFQLVQDGSCVMLDSGTTTAAVAEALKKHSFLTVITNSVDIAAQFSETDFEVILTGGTLRKNSSSLVGPVAEDVLQELHADILFLATDGFDMEIGLTTPNQLEARVNRAMVASSRRVVVVCDSTKFARRSLSRIVPIAAVHHVITDKALPEEIAAQLRDRAIELTLV